MVEYSLAKAEVEGSSPFFRFFGIFYFIQLSQIDVFSLFSILCKTGVMLFLRFQSKKEEKYVCSCFGVLG